MWIIDDRKCHTFAVGNKQGNYPNSCKNLNLMIKASASGQIVHSETVGSSVNMNWTIKLSLFGGNWKSLIFKISIGINDYTHKDPKNQVDLIFQLFVYILQQF